MADAGTVLESLIKTTPSKGGKTDEILTNEILTVLPRSEFSAHQGHSEREQHSPPSAAESSSLHMQGVAIVSAGLKASGRLSFRGQLLPLLQVLPLSRLVKAPPTCTTARA